MEPARPPSIGVPAFLQALRTHGLARPSQEYPSRKVVIRQGDAANTAFVVEAGCVCTYVRLPNGRRQRLRLVRTDGVVGLDALGRDRHPSTSEIIAPARLCSFSLEVVQRLATIPVEVWRGLAYALADEIAERQERMCQIALGDPVKKVAVFLAQLLDNGSYPDYLYQRDIAEFLLMAPETVNRTLAILRRRGALWPGSGLRMRDRTVLQRLADSAA